MYRHSISNHLYWDIGVCGCDIDVGTVKAGTGAKRGLCSTINPVDSSAPSLVNAIAYTLLAAVGNTRTSWPSSRSLCANFITKSHDDNGISMK